jgi:hypothetical protein
LKNAGRTRRIVASTSPRSRDSTSASAPPVTNVKPDTDVRVDVKERQRQHDDVTVMSVDAIHARICICHQIRRVRPEHALGAGAAAQEQNAGSAGDGALAGRWCDGPPAAAK